MQTSFAESLNRHRLPIVLCLLVLFVTVLAAPQRLAQEQTPAAAAPVETIDLLSWKSRDGRTLAQAMQPQSLAMLVIVDPACEACTKSKDSLRAFKERVEESKIKYFILMVPSDNDTSKYLAFADSLKLDAEVFVWSNSEAKPSAPIATMPAMSHLLISSEGGVANKWSGIPPKF